MKGLKCDHSCKGQITTSKTYRNIQHEPFLQRKDGFGRNISKQIHFIQNFDGAIAPNPLPGGVPLFSILNYTSQAFDSKVEACDQQCAHSALPGHTSINHPEGNTFSNT